MVEDLRQFAYCHMFGIGVACVIEKWHLAIYLASFYQCYLWHQRFLGQRKVKFCKPICKILLLSIYV